MSKVIERFYHLKESNGDVDGGLLLGVLEEIKSFLGSGEKPLEYITSVIHDIIEVSVDLEIINDEVFGEISWVSSLVLEWIPGDPKRGESLRSICDTYMVLIDISESSKRRSKYRDLIVSQSHSALLSAVFTLKEVDLIANALRCFNSLITNSSLGLRKDILSSDKIHKLVNLLGKVGDYDTQVSALEAIVRLLPQKEQQTELLSYLLESFGNQVVEAFAQIQRRSFDVDVRNFLIEFNKLFSGECKVTSIPCLRIEVSGLPLHKPRDKNYNEFWVDFNEGTRSIFINCLQSDEQTDDASWDSLTIKNGSVLSIHLNRSMNENQVQFKLKNSANNYFDSSTAIAFEGKDVEIFFDSKYELRGILYKIFDNNLIVADSSPPRPVMFDRKRDRKTFSQENKSEGSSQPLIMDVSPIKSVQSQEKMASQEAQEPVVTPSSKKSPIKEQTVKPLPPPIESAAPQKENPLSTMGGDKQKKPSRAKKGPAAKGRPSNKRKLFSETRNFMESDGESKEVIKKPKEVIKKPKKAPKAPSGKYCESTPVCKGKNKEGAGDFSAQVSPIQQGGNTSRPSRNRKKGVSYVETSAEESNMTFIKKNNKKGDSGFISVYEVESPRSPVFKKDPKLLTYGYRRRSQKKSYYEPELLRDEPQRMPEVLVPSSPEVSLKEMMISKKTSSSSSPVDLPEFQPSGEEADTNKDSGIQISSSRKSDFSSMSQKGGVSDETRLILDKLESMEASYKLRAECLEDLLRLKTSFNNSLDAIINKVKNVSS